MLVGLSAGLLGISQLQPLALATPRYPGTTLTLLPQEVSIANVVPAAPRPVSRDALTHIATQPPVTPHMETLRVIAHRTDTLPPAGVETDIRVGQPQLTQYLPLELVTPTYPKRALARGIEGTVRLEFAIDAQGHAQAIKILGRANPLLAQAAISALAQSRFARPTLNQQPFTLTGVIEEYRFRIRTEPPDT